MTGGWLGLLTALPLPLLALLSLCGGRTLLYHLKVRPTVSIFKTGDTRTLIPRPNDTVLGEGKLAVALQVT